MSIEAFSNIKGVSPFCWFPLDFCSPPGLMASGNPSLFNVTFCLFSNLLHLYIYIYVILSVRVSDTVGVFSQPAWVWPSGWQAASARAPDSLPVSKPRARFRSSRSSRGLVPPASNKLATAPHRVPPLRSPLPAPALSLNAERKLGRSPSEQGLARNICTRDLYWKKSSRGSFASKPRKRGTLENLYFPIRRLPTSSPASYVPISTNQPACPTSFPTQPNYLANQNNLFDPVCYLFSCHS